MSLIICVVSQKSEKGKTTLIEQLINRFTIEKFKVATVKHIHGSFDTKKKDTWRHLEAGAIMTVASTLTEVVTLRRIIDPPLEESLEAIHVKPDLILVEGYKGSLAPKILCADNFSETLEAIKDIPNIIMISGPIINKSEERKMLMKKFPQIPAYSFEEIVSDLKERLVKRTLKSIPGLNSTTLKVDGKIIPLGRFPRKFLIGVIRGVLGSLKDVKKNPREIEILIRAGND